MELTVRHMLICFNTMNKITLKVAECNVTFRALDQLNSIKTLKFIVFCLSGPQASR